eukprot:TRINITY_DN61764_c0_g1_i1.p1 TRINITY_DN61764_c0_g1~~TRINITY_DN61764_c0_g1_i1.p1  ORF type:complete len:113 (+),score=28.26 TRINITY_DN61764_c0_g1_i1:71-409(+)
MIRRPPISTLSSSSAASDVYKRQSLRTKSTQTPYAPRCSTPHDRIAVPTIIHNRTHTTFTQNHSLNGRHCPDQLSPAISSQYMPVPVSYTHLRAHETPEHLVCRLLLEKKKN